MVVLLLGFMSWAWGGIAVIDIQSHTHLLKQLGLQRESLGIWRTLTEGLGYDGLLAAPIQPLQLFSQASLPYYSQSPWTMTAGYQQVEHDLCLPTHLTEDAVRQVRQAQRRLLQHQLKASLAHSEHESQSYPERQTQLQQVLAQPVHNLRENLAQQIQLLALLAQELQQLNHTTGQLLGLLSSWLLPASDHVMDRT